MGVWRALSGLALTQGTRAVAQCGLVDALAAARAISCSASSQQAAWPTSWQQQQAQQAQPQQQSLVHMQPLRWLSSSSSTAAADMAASSQRQQKDMPNQQEIDKLLQVLLQPVQNTGHKWNAQLSPYLMKVNDQLLYQPQAVLLSVLRALHVIRGMLQEDAQVYVVENNKLLRPLVQTAAKSCLNPNMWFYHHTWSPGMLTNYASHNRLFKEAHQPNRRLFAAKGYRMVNPLCPEPPTATSPLPRLSWDDKWLLYRRTRRPGYRQLLEDLLEEEDQLHKFRAAGSLRGTPKDLRLMVFLDSTKNQVAIKEAYLRNIPTVAIVNSVNEMKYVTYPVLARDFHPGFVHFFLDWIVKVANAAPMKAPEVKKQLLAATKRGR